jgi:hypothetical protein
MGSPKRLVQVIQFLPDGLERLEREIGGTPAATDRRPDSPPSPTRAEDRSIFMPIPIERASVDGADARPGGLTWVRVAERRVRRDIPEILVPVAVVPGWVGRGVPHVDRVPLRRP